jgi:hypothetical protein
MEPMMPQRSAFHEQRAWACPRLPVDNTRFTAFPWSTGLATASAWPDKIIALLRARNPAAAIAQIKVAPGVRELRALEKAMAAAQLQGKWKDVEVAIAESLQALSAPRLHRSP